MRELICPYKSGPCASIWKIGLVAYCNGEPIESNPYNHPRAPQYRQAWIAGFEAGLYKPKVADGSV